jgi:hypothetical protein
MKVRKLRVDGWVQHYHVSPNVRPKEGFVAIPFRLREIPYVFRKNRKNVALRVRARTFIGNTAICYIAAFINRLSFWYYVMSKDASEKIKDDRALLIVPVEIANVLRKGVFFRDEQGFLHSILNYIEMEYARASSKGDKPWWIFSPNQKEMESFGDKYHGKVKVFASEEFYIKTEDSLGYWDRYLEVI